MDFDPREFDQPSMWTTYADLKGPTAALLTQRPPARADDGPLDDFTQAVDALGLHGAIAATALVTEGCGLLGGRLDKHPRTIVALLSRVVPWRTPVGVTVNATLSAWVAHNTSQTMTWCQKMLDDGDGEALARGYGERLIFLLETSALWAERPPWEEGQGFADRFFAETT